MEAYRKNKIPSRKKVDFRKTIPETLPISFIGRNSTLLRARRLDARRGRLDLKQL
jgi:hypothetical protein